MTLKISLILTFFLLASTGAEKFALTAKTSSVLKKYCYDCHDEDTQKGKVRLDNLTSLSLEKRLELLNKVQEQVHFKEMPPPKKKKQPSEVEYKSMASWLSLELKKHNASTLEEKMRYADYGNYIDHEKLFSGEIKSQAYTPARRWLVSPQIFNERVVDIFKHSRQRNLRFYGVTNPIILPSKTGVRYYDNVTLDGGHLLIMLTNAEWLSKKQIFAARQKSENAKIENPRDKWFPKVTPPAFEKIIFNKSTPARDEIIAAIQTQFDCVLGRQANEKELEEYLSLTKEAITLTGNTEGLRQMLKSVILESEFLYRMEFGAGPKDQFGRKKLSPEEAAFAISYALGDRGPDAKLIQAAKDGKLLTKADYKREVTRLLADKNYYKSLIDPALGGRNLRTLSSSHPKINRFFREFFGYSFMEKVFKDRERSGGFYQNASRGTAGTAGRVTDEIDKIVDLILKEDKDVFVKLLTTDKYFVYDYNYKTGAKTIARWKAFYDKYKNTDWKKNEAEVVKASNKLVAASKAGGGHTTRIDRFMKHMDNTFGKNRQPFPVFPWAHGYSYRHSQIYSLPTLPQNPYKEGDYWSYPLKQPFKIANRKGILTHPSWLVAHSQNDHTDPVIRGKWIREKLLAGRVPDVPITVDAVVPEDPHKTLRERFDAVTGKSECWKCHQYMNPLGYAFEMYDDFGRFRTKEKLEHADNIIGKGKEKYSGNIYKTKAVDTTGALSGTGDSKLDGKVTSALDLIDRLAKSSRVRQSIIRHAFRFYMGRNEMLSDSQTLIDADNAYVKSGGSFNAVIVSLLTSDSFIYRKN